MNMLRASSQSVAQQAGKENPSFWPQFSAHLAMVESAAQRHSCSACKSSCSIHQAINDQKGLGRWFVLVLSALCKMQDERTALLREEAKTVQRVRLCRCALGRSRNRQDERPFRSITSFRHMRPGGSLGAPLLLRLRRFKHQNENMVIKPLSCLERPRFTMLRSRNIITAK